MRVRERFGVIVEVGGGQVGVGGVGVGGGGGWEGGCLLALGMRMIGKICWNARACQYLHPTSLFNDPEFPN